MKKLIIAAFAAALSVAANAAVANWTVSNLYIPVANNLAADQTGIIANAGDKFGAGDLLLSLYFVDSESAEHLITSSATTGIGIKKSEQFWSQADAIQNRTELGRYIDLVVHAKYETAAGTYNFTAALNDVDFGSVESKNVAATFNAMNIGSWNYTANVPEPTSGLLLLLGMAGLALKRKQA